MNRFLEWWHRGSYSPIIDVGRAEIRYHIADGTTVTSSRRGFAIRMRDTYVYDAVDLARSQVDEESRGTISIRRGDGVEECVRFTHAEIKRHPMFVEEP